ncbi:MAG: oligosaccharide flippase family protein [Acidobacteria bacterium]|nr:oligosaccharide flippase family protein [Acidobacteriota bacterium]
MSDKRTLFSRVRQSQYGRHVALLASGTAIAQAIGFAASPILTRIYSPESYAVLALFMAISSSLSLGISGRYDLAAIVARDPRDSRALVALALRVSGVLCLLFFGFLFLGQSFVSPVLNAESLGTWLLVAPVALFLTAVATTLRSLANSRRNYKVISRVAIYQSLIAVTLSLTLGHLKWGANGLITATIVSLAFGAIYLIYAERSALRQIPWRRDGRLWSLALRYREYPLISAPTSFLNGLMLWMPVFFLTKYFPEESVGHYALFTRVATAPLTLIAGAVSQVNLKEMAERVHGGRAASEYLRRITIVMVAIALAPTIAFVAAGPQIFALVFGETWRTAGELLAILMPALAVRFVVSPLSGALISTGHVRLGGAWQVLAALVTFATFALVAPRASIRGMFVAMLITDVALYALYYFLIVYAVRHPKET